MRTDLMEMSKFDEMVRDWNASLTDVRMPLEKVAYSAGGNLGVVTEGELYNTAFKAKLNDQGFRSMCDRLGAPAGWMRSDKCPADLEETIVNRLKEDSTEPSLLRFRGFDDIVCRAVLSKQYLTYNHLDLWVDVLNSIMGTKLEALKPKIWKPSLGDRMDLWVLFDGVIADPDNDVQLYDGGGAGGLKPAIHLGNGEDGTKTIRINSGFYRGFCRNGVMFGFKSEDSFAAIHKGFSKNFMRAKVAMAVAQAARNCGLGIDRFLETTTIEIKTGAIDQIVNEWAGKYKLSVATSEVLAKAVAGVRTQADLVMATSDFAGTIQDVEEQTTLEEMAGAILFADLAPRHRNR